MSGSTLSVVQFVYFVDNIAKEGIPLYVNENFVIDCQTDIKTIHLEQTQIVKLDLCEEEIHLFMFFFFVPSFLYKNCEHTQG